MVTFITKNFHELTVDELHRIYYLRAEVFVVEQKCAYQDVDEKDPGSLHVLMYKGDRICGYARILPAGISYASVSIGRVLVEKEFRAHGHGRQLMLFCLQEIKNIYGISDITISAQEYLKEFYTSLGFLTDGAAYDEDGIPHLKMHLVSQTVKASS